MLHSYPTLVFNLLSFCPFCIFSLCPLLLAILLGLLFPRPTLTPTGFINRMLEFFKPGALNYFLSSHPVDLESNQSSSSTFRIIPGFSALRSDRTHSRSGIFSRDAMHASGGVVIIFVMQGLCFSKLSTSYLSSLDPYSDYVGVNISSSLPFLNVYAPPIRFSPTNNRTNFFLPPFFPPPEMSSFWGTSTAITLSGTQEVLPTHVGRKYSTGSSLVTSSPQ